MSNADDDFEKLLLIWVVDVVIVEMPSTNVEVVPSLLIWLPVDDKTNAELELCMLVVSAGVK